MDESEKKKLGLFKSILLEAEQNTRVEAEFELRGKPLPRLPCPDPASFPSLLEPSKLTRLETLTLSSIAMSRCHSRSAPLSQASSGANGQGQQISFLRIWRDSSVRSGPPPWMREGGLLASASPLPSPLATRMGKLRNQEWRAQYSPQSSANIPQFRLKRWDGRVV